MSKSQSQSGNALIVVFIIIGSLLVVGVLGFVVWNNFFNVPKTKIVTVNQSDKPVDTPVDLPAKFASDETLGSGLTVEYPDNWTNVHVGATDPTSTSEHQIDQNTITSPSGAIQVLLTVEKNSQIGGLCSNDYIKLKYLTTDTMPNFAEARFVAYVVYYPNTDFYQYHVGIQKNTDEIVAVTTENNLACRFMYSEYIDLTSSLPNAPSVRALLAIRFPAVGEGNNLKTGFTEAQVIEKLSGEEYEQAKKIVQSLK